ncbi:hypothetical protein C7S16_0796 [Burkholderia thailandensis]|uniref:Uncharacterized protein n=1 Tax=Burkholderia thailandensis TaxID=57975 RepID=A0AAW9D635_BURTH|nr:hypothetical protein [Burkholderia thailandensis]MDW9257451.1 hypothetical protein [Burkholderia thailandensis]
MLIHGFGSGCTAHGRLAANSAIKLPFMAANLNDRRPGGGARWEAPKQNTI